ncbi:MAG: TetR family transcriptional regulator C-terminal domain-containing protein [Actinomycetes bacterium]
MTSLTRADQVAARRAELLEAAHRVVLERGLANTRVADVAQATDVSGGLIHYHFATKDILLTEMMRAAAAADIKRARQIASGRGTALERLDKVLRHYMPATGDDQSWLLWIDGWGAALRNPAIAAISEELDTAWVDVVESVIRDGQASGEFTCDDPAAAAIRLAALLDGLGVRYTLARSVSRKQLLEHARKAAILELGLARDAFANSAKRL